MGRTNPTYRDQIRRFETRWSDYRRALRIDERPHFDRLLEHARAHADAASYCNATDPTDPLALSIDLEQERRIAALEEKVRALEEKERDRETNDAHDDPDRDASEP